MLAGGRGPCTHVRNRSSKYVSRALASLRHAQAASNGRLTSACCPALRVMPRVRSSQLPARGDVCTYVLMYLCTYVWMYDGWPCVSSMFIPPHSSHPISSHLIPAQPSPPQPRPDVGPPVPPWLRRSRPEAALSGIVLGGASALGKWVGGRSLAVTRGHSGPVVVFLLKHVTRCVPRL